MADLIRETKPKRGARFVCMEGADQLVSHNFESLILCLMTEIVLFDSRMVAMLPV